MWLIEMLEPVRWNIDSSLALFEAKACWYWKTAILFDFYWV